MKNSDPSRYSPSIVDRINAWVDNVDLPNWFVFVGFYILFLLNNQGTAWLEGSAEFGQFELSKVQTSIWPVLTLALIKYLDRIAKAAALAFQPLRKHNIQEYKVQVFELLNMPARTVWILILFTPTLVLLSYILDLNFVSFHAKAPSSLFAEILSFGIGFSPFPIFVYHTLRQMKLVSLIHAELEDIDLFNSTPLYSFSVLTSRTGMAWVFLLSTTLLFTIITSDSFGYLPSTLFYSITLMEIALAVASFILPLISLHNKMENAKSLLIDGINVNMEEIIRKTGSQARKLNPSKAAVQYDLVQTIQAQHDYVSKLPTWPWNTDTLRAFLSVIILPILLSIIQTIIDRLF